MYCPFCKSDFLALSWTRGNDFGNDLWYAFCLNCHAHSEHFSTQEKALKAWNDGEIYRECRTMTL